MLDPGFSSIKSLYLDLKERDGKARIEKCYDIIKGYIVGFPERPFLERLDFDIDFLEYQKIMKDRDRAIAAGMLIDPTTVKGKIRFNNQTYKVKLRLKGDLGDHWISKQRVSLRVSIKGKKTILGFKKFSIHKPRARQHPFDATFQALARHAGGLSPQHKYVRVYVNGSSWGVMNMEEHISKELLEKQNVKDSLVVKFSNDKKWLTEKNTKLPAGYRLSDSLLNLSVFGEKKYLTKKNYRKQFTYIAQERLKENHAHLYSIDQYSKILLLAALWNNYHTLANTNCRHYYNPYTLKLEPLTTDQGKFLPIETDKQGHWVPIGYTPFNQPEFRDILSSEAFERNFQNNVGKVKKAIHFLGKELNYYHSFFPLDKYEDTGIVYNNFQIVNRYQGGFFEQNNLNSQGAKEIDVQKKISTREAAVLSKHIHVRHYDNGILELYNLLKEPVTLKKIFFNGKNQLVNDIVIPGYTNYRPYIIKTKITGVQDNDIIVETEFKGHVRKVDSGITLISDGISNPLLNATPDDLPFLQRTKRNSWKILPGSWDIKEPLTVNGSLQISPGTTLRFAEKAYLIIKGSIDARGKEGKGIVLESQKNGWWKGIYIINAEEKSYLENIIIRHTKRLEDGILSLTGGVTFYSSNIVMKNIIFDGSQAEDALNIVHSTFSLSNIEIQSTASDAFDSDFSSGKVQNSSFKRINGDGVDFSGSSVTLTHNEFVDIKDKAVSVGEASSVHVLSCYLKNVGVGIAVKDGSRATFEGSTVDGYTLSAAMSYIKKDFYDSPLLLIKNSEFGENTQTTFMRQIGTSMLMDGEEVSATDFDTKDLYETEIMKK
ncbi:MAG: right-handed parallel beta-helix repeat-containing protein [Candidatus Electrothrix sp. GW3-4]|uniref:right-handed parallel beta-helix repeat-containing protein n=1 Tax=Candidatus Electrothrix sp. GW3-4 TaxID=3126740 RepID=UPI0030D17BDE